MRLSNLQIIAHYCLCRLLCRLFSLPKDQTTFLSLILMLSQEQKGGKMKNNRKSN
jgi:hypothetical protein